MRLLQLIESAATGAGRHVLELSEGLARQGHEVHLLYSPLRCDEVFANGIRRLAAHPNVRAVSFAMRKNPGISDYAAARALRKYVRGHGPFDVIHCHSTKAGWLGRAALMGKSKIVFTPHLFFHADASRGAIARVLGARAESSFAHASEKIIAVSQAEFDEARRIGIPAEKLVLIPNGVAIPEFIDDVERNRLRAEWGVAADDVCVAFVGRFTEMKAPDVLLKAFAVVRRDRWLPGKLVMIGDGPLGASLKELARQLSIEEDVLWLGARDARSLLCAVDALALTSVSEGHPLVVLEAMAHGVPVVATAVGGIAGTVRDQITGFVAPIGDVDMIAHHLKALAADVELRRSMGRASRLAAKEFSADRMVDRTAELYTQLIAGPESQQALSSQSSAVAH
ncbi:MAG: glycosyltransferase [Bryobacteraceae bacterium]